jgi:hypothetical protein
MQIIQAGPSKQTLRQAALDDALKGMIGGFEDYNKQQATKRQEALQLAKMTKELRDEGYDVTEDMVKKSIEPESGVSKLFAGTKVGDFFGVEKQERPDLYGKRTQEYQDKQKYAAEDRKFKRMSDMADLEYKQTQAAKLRSEMGPGGYEAKKKEFEMKKLENEMALTPQQKAQNELTFKQQEDLGKKSANLYSVKVAMDEALNQLKSESLSEDEKIKVGQGLLKLLNSAEGADAVGAEEAQRIGSYLEHKMFNVFQPGSMFGRDLDLFTDQVKNNSDLLSGRIRQNQSAIDALASGRKLSDLVGESGKMAGTGGKELAPLDYRGQNANVNFSPTSGPDMIGGAQAAKATPAINHPEANAALEWAQKNPNNPKAREIMGRLGGR